MSGRHGAEWGGAYGGCGHAGGQDDDLVAVANLAESEGAAERQARGVVDGEEVVFAGLESHVVSC